MNLPYEIKVDVTRDHLKQAGPYTDTLHCLLATAIKDMGFSIYTHVGVDAATVYTQDGTYTAYTFEKKYTNRLYRSYYPLFKYFTLPMTVTLTRLN